MELRWRIVPVLESAIWNFINFIPHYCTTAEYNNILISEALRGEGAYLRLVENKKRFMQHYAPQKLELATRDVVARAIFTEIERSAYNYVYLDITHHPKNFYSNIFLKVIAI